MGSQLLTSSALDAVVGSVTNTTGTSFASNSITTTATDLLLGIVYTPTNGSAGFASSSPWATVIDCTDAADGDSCYVQYQDNVSSGAGKAAAGTNSSSTKLTASIISYKDAAAATCTPALALLGVGRCG